MGEGEGVLPGAQGEGGLGKMSAAPAGDGGLVLTSGWE